jgi:photosystem II stability/assembly factor-like uncharacterized protein
MAKAKQARPDCDAWNRTRQNRQSQMSLKNNLLNCTVRFEKHGVLQSTAAVNPSRQPLVVHCAKTGAASMNSPNRTLLVHAILMVLLATVTADISHAQQAIALHAKVRPLLHAHQGPFVKREDGAIVAVNSTESLVSRDGGQTWNARSLFTAEQQAARPLSAMSEPYCAPKVA